MDIPVPPKYQQSIDRLVIAAVKDFDHTSMTALHDINAGHHNSPYAFFICGLVAHDVTGNPLAAEALFRCADFYGLADETRGWAQANCRAFADCLKAGNTAVAADAGADGADGDAYGSIVDAFAERYAADAGLFLEHGTEGHERAERGLVDLLSLRHPFLSPFPTVFRVLEDLRRGEGGFEAAMTRFLGDKATYDAETRRTALLPHNENPARTEFLETVAGKLSGAGRRLRILDFGSSSGRNIDALYRLIIDAGGEAPEIHGIDPGADAIAEMGDARPHLIGHVGDQDSLAAAFADSRFDLMVASSVLLLLPPDMVETVIGFAGGHCDAVALLDYPSNVGGDRPLPRCLGEPYHVMHPFRRLLAQHGFEKVEVQGFRRPLRSYAAGIYAARAESPFVD